MIMFMECKSENIKTTKLMLIHPLLVIAFYYYDLLNLVHNLFIEYK